MNDFPAPRGSLKILDGPLISGERVVLPDAPLPPPMEPSVKAMIDSSTELQLFMLLSGFEGTMCQIRDELSSGRIDVTVREIAEETSLAISSLARVISYARKSTERFGVTFGGIMLPDHLREEARDREYDRWYGRWQKYIQGLSFEDWLRAKTDMETDGADVSWIHPPTPSWK